MSPDPVTSYLQRIRTETLDEVAGFAPEASGLSIAQIAASGWRLHEALSTPVAVLDAAALDHNLRKMATWCADRDVLLQPHGKTTMAPQLFARQIAAGLEATGFEVLQCTVRDPYAPDVEAQTRRAYILARKSR